MPAWTRWSRRCRGAAVQRPRVAPVRAGSPAPGRGLARTGAGPVSSRRRARRVVRLDDGGRGVGRAASPPHQPRRLPLRGPAPDGPRPCRGAPGTGPDRSAGPRGAGGRRKRPDPRRPEPMPGAGGRGPRGGLRGDPGAVGRAGGRAHPGRLSLGDGAADRGAFSRAARSGSPAGARLARPSAGQSRAYRRACESSRSSWSARCWSRATSPPQPEVGASDGTAADRACRGAPGPGAFSRT
jgi:hypothetical protein